MPFSFNSVREGRKCKLIGDLPFSFELEMKKSPDLGTNVLVTKDSELVFVPMAKDHSGINMQLKLVEGLPESFSIYCHVDRKHCIVEDSNGTYYHLTILPKEIILLFQNI